MRRRHGILLLALVLTACGDAEEVASPASKGTVAGVGVLPEALSRSPHLEVTTSSTSSTLPRPTVIVDREELPPIGERVEGNRLLMIGDSILASTSRRYTGEMCLGLVPLDWAVEVDAEKSRFIDFGTRVLNARLDPEAGVDWDAAAVFLGTNYGGDIEVYTRELDAILGRLAPRPTLLYTVTEFRPNRADVNAAIQNMLAFYPNVQIIDWAKITAEDPSLLGADGYHPSPAGISRLVLETAIALGGAPTGAGGDCRAAGSPTIRRGPFGVVAGGLRRRPAVPGRARRRPPRSGPVERPPCRRADPRPPSPRPRRRRRRSRRRVPPRHCPPRRRRHRRCRRPRRRQPRR